MQNNRQDHHVYTKEFLEKFDFEAGECLERILGSLSSLKEQLSNLSIQRLELQEHLNNARRAVAFCKEKALISSENDLSSNIVFDESIFNVISSYSYIKSNLLKSVSVRNVERKLKDVNEDEDVIESSKVAHNHGDIEEGIYFDASEEHEVSAERNNITIRNYVQLAPLRKSDEFIVSLTHLLSPDLMFFRRSGSYSRPFHMLQLEINKFYSVSENLCFEELIVGSPCVVRAQGDQYQRARIVSNDNNFNVNVFLVDFGENKNVDMVDVFHIPDKFLEFPTMSLEVKMAAIIPHKGVHWSSSASEILRSKLKDKEVTMIVYQESDDNCSLAEVLIYESDIDEDICLNYWLVLQGLAMFKEDAITKEERVIKKSSSKVYLTKDQDSSTKGSYSCKIINFVSPASIFIRKLTDEDSFRHLNQEMQSHYSTSICKSQETKWHQGSVAAFYQQESNTWVRVKIIKKTGVKVELFLLDSGKTCRSKTDFLEPLLQKFKMKNLTEEVCLSGVFPSSNNGKWSKSANKLVLKYLEDSNMIADIEQDGKAGHERVPVKMSVSLVKDGRVVEINLQDNLVKEGFGNFVAQSKSKVLSIRPSIKDHLDVDMSKFYGEEEIQHWQEHPELKLNSQLLSCATHVDWDGFIYLNLNSSIRRLNSINEEINKEYQDSSQTEEDKFWSEGQAAIAKWHVDNKWYRASVLSVHPNRCKAKLVDYGTEETFLFTSMRKKTMHQDVPVQCFRFKLDNICPVDEVWSEDKLIEFHELVVDKEVLAFPKTKEEDNKGCYYTGKMKMMSTGEDLSNIIVKNNVATFVHDSFE